MMGYAVSASNSISSSSYNSLIHHNHTICSSKSQFTSALSTNYPLNLPYSAHILSTSRSQSLWPISCSSSPGPGDGDSRTVLDAFFLGKALGEAVTERVESVVGEILSTVGRLQAEQQKQIQEFQEDVFDRAKKAKEQAAREALELQSRQIPRSTRNVVITNDVSSTVAPPPNGSATANAPPVVVESNVPASSVDENSSDKGPFSSIPIDD